MTFLFAAVAMGNSRSGHDLVLREMPRKVRELHYAVMDNDRESVRTLVANGVNVNFPWYNPSNPSIKDGSTPLICAVSLNRTEILDVSHHVIKNKQPALKLTLL